MNKQKRFSFLLFFLFIFSLLIFAKSAITLYINKEGVLSLEADLDGRITSAMTDNLKAGIEANIKYNFSLYKKTYTLGISTFSLVKTKTIEYNLKWDNLNYAYIIYNKENNFEYESLSELEKFIFKHKFENVFKITAEGRYFIKLDFSFETLKLVPPFSFILMFINIYNIKVDDLKSNDIKYEISEKNKNK